MKTKKQAGSIIRALLFAVLTLCVRPALAQVAAPMRLVQTIPMPDVEKRIDHLAVDVPHQRLFVAALGNNTVEVLDLHAGKSVHSIGGLHEPQGIAYVVGSNRLFVANAQGGACDIFNADTYQSIGSVPLGEDADNVRYDAKANRIYVGYGDGALGIMDSGSSKRLGAVRLSGHPESFQLEKSGPRIFVNVPAAGHVAVIDRNKQQVVATWTLSNARSNFPMALDEAGHRLFIGCRDPARVLIYDTASGKQTGTLEISGDTDDLFYDAAQKRLYVSCGAGFLDVFQQKDASHFERTGHIATAAGARTSLFVPELTRLYLAVPHRGSRQAEIRVYEVQP
jgi:DNA-binding beta-propeller fold protein YncE